MGYFSQRKKQARENLFMLISLSVLTIIYICLFFDNGENAFLSALRKSQFHLYLYNIFLVLYTLYHKKFGYVALAALLMMLNYSSLAKTTRLFCNDEGIVGQVMKIEYKKGEQQHIIVSEKTSQEGKLDLSPNMNASYVKVQKSGQEYTIITLDFKNKSISEYKTAYANLEKFILMQNNPVIVIGDFGIPSWDPLFREFLRNTQLEVKNRILFTDGKQLFKFWQVPSINILGFENIKIQQINLNKGKFKIELGF